MSRPLVIYHAACRDGFCAAWAFWTREPHAEFFPAAHGSPPPDVAGRDVVMVDFSYPRLVMDEIAAAARSLVVLDHHKTAEAALADFRPPNATVVFDMQRSGAGITWEHYWPGRERPWIVSYVEDRDLWRHALPNGPAVNAFLSTLRFDFEAWYQASRMDVSDAAKLGVVVEDKIRQYVIEVGKNARRIVLAGHDVPIVNAPQVDVSELGSYLAHGEPFAVAWWQRSDGSFSYSLRSHEPSDIDVSEIAKRFGGGGHRRAAGFQLPNLLISEAPSYIRSLKEGE